MSIYEIPNSKELPPTGDWNDVFTRAGETGCLISGSRHGLDFEVIDMEEGTIHPEEDSPAVLQFSRITNSQLEPEIIFATLEGIPVDAYLYNTYRFAPGAKPFSELIEERESAPFEISYDDVRELEQHLRHLPYLEEDDRPSGIYFNGHFWELDDYVHIESRSSIFQVDKLSLSRERNTVHLFGRTNPLFQIGFDIRHGVTLTRETITLPDNSKKYCYKSFSGKKIGQPRLY